MKKKKKEFKITREELQVYIFDYKKRGGKIEKLHELADVPIKRYNSSKLGRDLF